jgi:hypothetical protein
MFKIFEVLRDTRLTRYDIVCLIIKIGILVGLCQNIGVLYGIIAFVIIDYLVDLSIRLIFGLDALNAIDKGFLYDQS